MQFTRSQFIGAFLVGTSQRQLGVQSISFRLRPLEAMLDAVVETGIGAVELWAGHVEPPAGGRSKQLEWRMGVDLDHFRKIRAMFDRRRIGLHSYDVPFRNECTDAEIDRIFEMARALGAGAISSSSEVSIAERLDGFARKHRVRVGFHNLSDLKSGQFARPDDYRKALNGRSEYLGVTLDIGHLTAAGFDPLEFLKEYHQRVFAIHLKDRKRDQGPPVPLGQGDTPVRDILLAIRDHGWKIPLYIECQQTTSDVVAEVKRMYDYARRALDG